MASASIQLIRDVESDAVAAAAIFGHAAGGAIRDEDAVASVRALVATRGLVDAVRLEVPDAGISTLIRKASSDADVPAAPAALRQLADERGVGFGVIGPARGLLVARVRPAGDAGAGAAAPPPPGGPAGYVVAEVPLDMLGLDLEVIAGRRLREPRGAPAHRGPRPPGDRGVRGAGRRAGQRTSRPCRSGATSPRARG